MSEEREQWGADLLEARSAGEAAEVLTRGVSGEAADRHPERRMKAAYAAFEVISLSLFLSSFDCSRCFFCSFCWASSVFCLFVWI